MKKASKISLAIIAPIATTAALIPLASCSAYWYGYIDPTIRFGEYVYGATHTNILLYDSFTIKLTATQEGYAAFDTARTKITIGSKDVKYRLVDTSTILVPAEYVTSTDISIYLEAKPTAVDFQANWIKPSAKWEYLPFGTPQPILHPASTAAGKAGDTLTFSDFTLQVKKGNIETAEWENVTLNDPNLHVYRYDWNGLPGSDWIEITQDFRTNGYTIQSSDLGRQFNFGLRYLTDSFEKHTILRAAVHSHVESIVKDSEVADKIKCGETLTVKATTSPDTALHSYTIVEITDLGTTEAKVSGRNKIVAGTKPGTIKYKIRAYDEKPFVYSQEYTLVIEK